VQERPSLAHNLGTSMHIHIGLGIISIHKQEVH
jgi:hypothetical protein